MTDQATPEHARVKRWGKHALLNQNEFQYIQEEKPLLVLGLECQIKPDSKCSHPISDNATLDGSRNWQFIAHQTAGHGCHQHYLIGIILQPRTGVLESILAISNEWYYSDLGCLFTPLDDVVRYRELLQDQLGVDCNHCYNKLEEGYYPIDCTREHLYKLCENKFPEDLDDMIEWAEGTSGFEKMAGFIGRWTLVILGDNCD